MSASVEDTFDFSAQPLGLGLELFDMQRRQRVSSRMDVALDGVPLPAPRSRWPRQHGGFFTVPDVLERIPRHSSCQHALLDRPDLPDPIAVRFLDPTRRFVPRRLSIPFTTRPVMLRPGFFPGAAYDPGERSTGLRGRAVTGPDGARVPLRWCRVLARNGTGDIVGRAHGDDRGEFLLLLESSAATIGDLVDPLVIDVTVYGKVPAPAPPDPILDPYWDLPLEAVDAPPANDDVVQGLALPDGYAAGTDPPRPVSFPLGRLKSEPDFVFNP